MLKNTGFVKIVPAHAVKIGDSVPNVGEITKKWTTGDGFTNFESTGLPLRCGLYADVAVTITPEEAFDLI